MNLGFWGAIAFCVTAVAIIFAAVAGERKRSDPKKKIKWLDVALTVFIPVGLVIALVVAIVNEDRLPKLPKLPPFAVHVPSGVIIALVGAAIVYLVWRWWDIATHGVEDFSPIEVLLFRERHATGAITSFDVRDHALTMGFSSKQETPFWLRFEHVRFDVELDDDEEEKLASTQPETQPGGSETERGYTLATLPIDTSDLPPEPPPPLPWKMIRFNATQIEGSRWQFELFCSEVDYSWDSQWPVIVS